MDRKAFSIQFWNTKFSEDGFQSLLGGIGQGSARIKKEIVIVLCSKRIEYLLKLMHRKKRVKCIDIFVCFVV